MSQKLPIHPKYAEAYGDTLTGLLKRSPYYDESQCQACPHEHRCCDLIVTCSAVEAFSIVEWVRANRADAEALLLRVADHAKEIHEFADGYATYADGEQRVSTWINDWFMHERKKCPFYDTEKCACGIYPVRPANCRKAFGKGDCTDGGIRTVGEARPLMFARALRVQSANLQLAGEGESEMTWLVSHMLTAESILHVSPENRTLLKGDPEALTPAELLYGFGGAGAWIEHPFEAVPEPAKPAPEVPQSPAAPEADSGIIL